MENDIAMIRLAAPVQIDDSSIAHLPIARELDSLQTGDKVVVTGFGTTTSCSGSNQSPDCDMQDQLREVEVPIVDTAACRTDYSDRPETIGDKQICAGLDDGGKDSCQGDSGGPLNQKDANNNWVQYGVVSWGIGCAVAHKPGIYTRVTAYSSWIGRNLGISPNNPVNVVVDPTDSNNATKSHLVTIAVDGGALHVGQNATFQITSKVDGYLLIFDVNPSGKTTQLFPNTYSGAAGTAATIHAGQTIGFPSPGDGFDIQVPQPAGAGLVVAVVTKSPVGLSDLMKSYGRMEDIEPDAEFYSRLEVVAKGKAPINPLTGKGDWAMGEAHYVVEN